MTTDRELMQWALAALDGYAQNCQCEGGGGTTDAAEALRARLAQPEQKHSEQWWRHEVSNAYANGYEKGRASVKQPEQEPVAWADKYDIERDGHDFWVSRQQPAKNGVPLYTAPPQSEWQGLTDEEIKNHWLIAMQSVEGTVLPIPEFALAIERALKEKNHG